MSELLEKQISTSLALRKVVSFGIAQTHKIYYIRPQLHPLIISPSGTFKSSLSKEIKEVIGNDLEMPTDTLTLAGLCGSINARGEYLKGFASTLGGRVMVLDELNNLKPDDLQGLLSILQNQTISRSLGNKTNKPSQIKNEWTDISVSDGMIKGSVYFSAIIYGMHWGNSNGTQRYTSSPEQLEALKSRLSPNFPTTEYDDAISVLRGKPRFNFNNEVINCGVGEIFIEKKAYTDFMNFYEYFARGFFEKDGILGKRASIGLVARVQNDILRMSAFEELQMQYKRKPIKKLIISSSKLMKEITKDYLEILLRQQMNTEPIGSYVEYLKVLRENPDLNINQYARLLNVSRKTIYRWNIRKKEEGRL